MEGNENGKEGEEERKQGSQLGRVVQSLAHMDSPGNYGKGSVRIPNGSRTSVVLAACVNKLALCTPAARSVLS
jgi:hypothetical protein